MPALHPFLPKPEMEHWCLLRNSITCFEKFIIFITETMFYSNIFSPLLAVTLRYFACSRPTQWKDVCLSHDTDNPERAWNLGNLPQNKPGSKASACGSAPLCVFISYLHSFSLTWSQTPGMHLFISKLKNNKRKNAIKEETAPKPPLPSMWILQEMNPLHRSANHWGMRVVPRD